MLCILVASPISPTCSVLRAFTIVFPGQWITFSILMQPVINNLRERVIQILKLVYYILWNVQLDSNLMPLA